MPEPALPTFLVVGAMKAGTTSLHDYLGQHPDVYCSKVKELRFFIDGPTRQRGVDWYAAQFAEGSGAAARGESSPDYSRASVHSDVPKRIRDLLPDVRLLYLVRDPVGRIESAYRHAVHFGVEDRPIDVAVREDATYLDDSRYAWQLDQFLEQFPSERVLVLAFEDLRDDPRRTVDRAFGFIGVDPDHYDPAGIGKVRNPTSGAVRPNRLARAASQSTRATWLRSRVPARYKKAVWRATGRSLAPDASQLSPESVASIRAALAEDTAQLRTMTGQAFESWGVG